MKQPFSVTVDREHGNSGDVIVTITDARGEQRKISTPGEESPYSALAGIRGALEEELNAWTEPKDGVPYCVVDVAAHAASVMIGGTEIGHVPLPMPPAPASEPAEHVDAPHTGDA